MIEIIFLIILSLKKICKPSIPLDSKLKCKYSNKNIKIVEFGKKFGIWIELDRESYLTQMKDGNYYLILK